MIRYLVQFACCLITLLSFYDVYAQEKKNDLYLIAYNIRIPDTTRDDWEIMVMNMDGTGKKNITNHPDVSWTYHASGKRLFFISDRDTCFRCYFLYEMLADGKSIRKVSDLRLEDSFMDTRNNGSELIVTGRKDNSIRFQLFIINTNTGEHQQLTNDTAARYGDPCFSPDGMQIVYSFKKNKRDRNEHEELYIMNSDGTTIKQLTHYPQQNISLKDFGYKAASARWHPTENFISYISKQDGKHSIFAISPDGKKQWKLTTNEFAEGWHSWSPDGFWLTFNSSDIEERQYHIMLMDWKSKAQTQLTDNTYKSQQAPVFILK